MLIEYIRSLLIDNLDDTLEVIQEQGNKRGFEHCPRAVTETDDVIVYTYGHEKYKITIERM